MYILGMWNKLGGCVELLLQLSTMSIADKISLLIAASKGSLAELALAKSRISAECASTVMSPTQTAIASQQQIIYRELINDPDINANVISRFPPDIYQNQNQNAAISLAGFAFRQVCLDRLRTQSALAGFDLGNLPAYAELEAALQGVHEAAQAVEKTWKLKLERALYWRILPIDSYDFTDLHA